MENLYSLWISPSIDVKKILQKIVEDLSEKYHGPSFEPHLTLLGDIPDDEKTIIQKAKTLITKLHSFPIYLTEISFSTTYFQSVLVRAKATSDLMNANLVAKEVYQLDNKLFMPHVSLLYGDHAMDVREKIASEVILPRNIKFNAEKIIVTPSTKNPNDWVHLAELSF